MRGRGILALALAVSPGVLVGAGAASDAVLEIERIEVLANRAPAADNSQIELRRLLATEPFTGVTREEFGRRANRRAGDIVARLPGVFMGGPPGDNKDARLRGLDKEFSRTQVDGLQLPDGGEKRELQLNRVPADLIQEVRVLRNPSPEFESDGLAGRIDLRFRPIPEGPLTGEFRLGGGERSGAAATRWQGTALLAGRLTESIGGLASFSYLDDPTYKLKSEVERFADGSEKKSVQENESAPTTSRDFFADAAWYYDGGELHLRPVRLSTLEVKTKTKASTDFTKTADKDESLEIESEQKNKLGEGLSLLHVQRFGGDRDFVIDSRVSWQRLTEGKQAKQVDTYAEKDGVLVADKRTIEDEDKADRTFAADSKVTLPLGAGRSHLVKLGISYRERDRHRLKTKFESKAPAYANPADKTGPKDNYLLNEDYAAVFLQDHWQINDRLTLLGGARFERVDFTSRTPVSTDVDRTFNDFNPGAQFLWRVSDTISVHVAASRALNRPKFDELSPYEQNDGKKVVRGNPALEPARAWRYDTGIVVARRNVFLAANLFHHRIDGLIEQLETGGLVDGLPLVQVRNVGDGWVTGVELEQRLGLRVLGFRAFENVTLWANQTWLDSEVTEAATGETHPFNGQPEFLANVGFDYEWRRLYVTASARYTGTRPGEESSADLKTQESEVVADAALHFRFDRGFSLFVEVNNLTNEEKRETTLKADGTSIVKLESTGRAWFAGLRYAF